MALLATGFSSCAAAGAAAVAAAAKTTATAGRAGPRGCGEGVGRLLSPAAARLAAAAGVGTTAAAARLPLLSSSASAAAAAAPVSPLSPALPHTAPRQHSVPFFEQQQKKQQQQRQRFSHGPSLILRYCFRVAASASQGEERSLRFFCSSAGGGESSSAQKKVVMVPSMGDSITEGSLGTWKKAVGDYVREGEIVAVIDTDKVSVDVTSPAAGRLLDIAAAAGETVEVGKPLFTLDLSAEAPTAAAAEAPQQQQQHAVQTKEEAARGHSAISAEPKQQQQQQAPPPAAAAASLAQKGRAAAASPPPAAGGAYGLDREERRVPMTRMRQRIAERLKAAQNAAAMLTTFNEVDMGNLMALRSELNSAFQETHGVKMGFVSAFMLAASHAIRKVPEVNAYIDGKDIVYKNYVDISVAVATPTGLVVPVVRDCQQKSWAQLEKDLASLADRARKGQIALEDMAGGTFTISNGGVYGSMMGTPIINPPQSSILGMHAVTKRAVVKDDQIIIRPMMYLALTYDHRLIDGREAVTFLRLIREYVEDPRKMLLGL